MGRWAWWAQGGVVAGFLLLAGCSYQALELERPAWLDGDFDAVGGDGSTVPGDDIEPGDAVVCANGFAPPDCTSCPPDTALHVDSEGSESCIPLCIDATFDCGHGVCAVQDDAEICACDPFWDNLEDDPATPCSKCSDGYFLELDECLPTCDTAQLNCGWGVCEADPGAPHCVCPVNFADENCEICADGFELVTNAGDCWATCETDGWLNCGAEAICDFDGVNTGNFCDCIAGYTDYDDGGAPKVCEPDCTTLGWLCDSKQDGGTHGECLVEGDGPYCLCDDGYQDNDLDGTCEPACNDASGNPRCTAGAACDDSHGPFTCSCPPGRVDPDGDGDCRGDCDASTLTACTDAYGVDYTTCVENGATAQCRCIVYVDANAPDGGDGKSWSSAINSPANLLDLIVVGMALPIGAPCDVWLVGEVGGLVYGFGASDFIPLTNGMGLYGGFHPVDAPDMASRDPETYLTILDAAVPSNAPAHFITATGIDIVIHGLEIRGGNATAADGDGAGIWATGADGLVVKQVKLSNNAASRGGAIALFDSVGVRLDDVIFADNTASLGGAVYVDNGSVHVFGGRFIDNAAETGAGTAGLGGGLYVTTGLMVEVVGSTFTGNFAADEGAGLYVDDSNLTLVNSAMVSNRGGYSGGGGALAAVGSSAKVTNCLFLSNGNLLSDTGAGAIRFTSGGAGLPFEVTSSTFVGNLGAGSTAAGIYSDAVPGLVANDIFWGPEPDPDLEAQLHGQGGASIDVSHCLVEHGAMGCRGGCVGEGSADEPLFVEVVSGERAQVLPHPTPNLRILEPVDSLPAGLDLTGSYLLPEAFNGNDTRYFQIVSNTTDQISFIDPTIANYSAGTEFKVIDFHLQIGSAGLDAGDGDLAPDRDFDRNPRVDLLGLVNSEGTGIPPFVDIGCYETQGP